MTTPPAAAAISSWTPSASRSKTTTASAATATTENAKPLDVSGGLPDGSKFSGVDGLQQALLKRPEVFAGTFTEKLMTYALGRGVETTDAPAVRKIVRETKE